MSWQELGEACLWSCLGTTITVVGSLAALIAILICYFRGTRSTRFPLVLAFFAVLSAIGCWAIFYFFDPPGSIAFVCVTSIAAFMAVASWIARFDRT